MKNRKITYTILTLVFAVAFYFIDSYNSTKEVSINKTSDKKEVNESVTILKKQEVELLPTSTTGQIVHHNFYSLSYNEAYEQAEWVAYTLKKEHLKNTQLKRPYFILDKKVTTKSAHYKNYKDSGYNKGHLCPAGDRKFSEEAFNETFLTSNISPQLYDFNGGVWNRLEQKTRYWAEKYESIFIVTGGVLNKNLKTIGSEKVAVPDYFYKIIIDISKPKIKAIAFLIPHQETQKGLYSFVTTIDEIEKLTGIDFFYNFPDDLENRIESATNFSAWSIY